MSDTFEGESRQTKRIREREETLKALESLNLGDSTTPVASRLVISWLEIAWEREDRDERGVRALERAAYALETSIGLVKAEETKNARTLVKGYIQNAVHELGASIDQIRQSNRLRTAPDPLLDDAIGRLEAMRDRVLRGPES